MAPVASQLHPYVSQIRSGAELALSTLASRRSGNGSERIPFFGIRIRVINTPFA